MKKIFTDTGIIGISHAFSALGLLGLQIFIVRTLPLHIFGVYAATLAFTSLIESTFIARSGEISIQLIGENWVKKRYENVQNYALKIIRSDLIINSTLYIILLVFALTSAAIFDFNANYLIILSLNIPLQIGFGVSKSVFISASKLKEQAFFEIGYVAIHVLTGFLGLIYSGVYGLLWASVLSTLAKTIIAARITGRWLPANISIYSSLISNLFSNPRINLHSFWSFSFHSITRNLFSNGANQLDLIILNAIGGSEKAALYKVAKSLASLPVKAAMPIWAALRPDLLSAWHKGNSSTVVRLIAIPNLIMLLVFLVSFVPIVYYSRDLIVFIYGNTYGQSARLFLILLIGYWIFRAMSAWYNFIIIISEKKISGTILYGLLFLFILIGGILVGGDSPTNMAWVVSGSMIITTLFCWSIFLHKIKFLSKNQL